MDNQYFDNVENTISKCSFNHQKELKYCLEIIELFNNEDENRNSYRKLASRFCDFEKGGQEDCDDWYYYKYLKSLDRSDRYIFPLSDGRTVEAKIDLFKPFDKMASNIINPKWHLIVACYAYIDAAYNHPDDENAKLIVEKNHDVWFPIKKARNKYPNKVLTKWMEEVLK